MAVEKGKDLMLFIDKSGTYKALACATSHTLTSSRDMIDSSCKDSGVFGNSRPGKGSWSITTDNLMVLTSYDELMDAQLNGTKLKVAFALAENATEGEMPSGGWTISDSGRYGFGYVTEVTATATNGEDATYSATITGDGELKKLPDTPAGAE